MRKNPSLISRLFILLLFVSLAGCSKESSTPLSPVVQPNGSITGVIKNSITGEPVASALISIGYNGSVQSVTTDNSGAFSFANVPVGQYQVLSGSTVASGTYTLTVSLVGYNSSQTDSTKRYRNYYYNTVKVIFTSAVDSISDAGLVGSVVFNISYLNTTVKGQVVDENMQPVANSLVTLVDETINPGVAIAQTSTGADGSYLFSQVDNGITVNIKAVSQNGQLQGSLPAFFPLPANITLDSLRTGVTAEQIMITPANDVNPFVINITPENNSDVSPGNLQIVYTFSEPIKQNEYTRVDANTPLGNNTMVDDIVFSYLGMKKSTDAFGFSASWNPSFSQLTITPIGIVPSARYSIDVSKVFKSLQFTDAAGKQMKDNDKITGDFDALNFTTEGASPVPLAPNVTRRYVPGSFGKLDYNGGTVGLEWNYDASARSYNIYKSVDGNPYQLLQSDFVGVQFSDNSGSLVVPPGANDPFTAGKVSYIVRGVSRDLVEGAASVAVDVVDEINPRLSGASVAPAGTKLWTYTLHFSEPINIATAENVNYYVFADTSGVKFTVTAANYLGFSGGSYVVELSVSTTAVPAAGYTLTVVGVTDLYGNGMDQTANNKTF